MKINKKFTALAIYLTLVYPQALNSFDDNFEDEFMAKMEAIEKSIQTSFNQFHQNLFQDLEAYKQDLNNRPKNHTDQTNQQNSIGNQNQNTLYYQQSSSSLSFSNQDKAIKITEQKNNETKIYTIEVTDKKAQPKQQDQEIDNVAALQELQTYMQKAFRAKQADKILQECINAISHEQKNKIVNIESSIEGNQKKYSVEISCKKDVTQENVDEARAKATSKKKQKNHYTPRKDKATKNS